MAVGFQHPAVKVHIGDGFEFLKNYKNSFDVIITDSYIDFVFFDLTVKLRSGRTSRNALPGTILQIAVRCPSRWRRHHDSRLSV